MPQSNYKPWKNYGIRERWISQILETAKKCPTCKGTGIKNYKTHTSTCPTCSGRGVVNA